MLNFNDPVAQKDGTIKPLSEGSGGGGGSEKYVVGETPIGTWVNGETLYRKVYYFPNGFSLPTAGTWSEKIEHSLSLSVVIDARAIADNGNFMSINFATDGGVMQFRNGVFLAKYVIVEYVK